MHEKLDGSKGDFGKYNEIADRLFGKKEMSAEAEALANDKRIENAVMYMLTEGYTITIDTGISALLNGQVGDPEAQREAIKKRTAYNDDITRLFKQFKNMIKTGEMTLEELENKIYAEFGVVSEQFRKQANPLEFDPEVKFMSEKDYELMRESYGGFDGEENTEK